MGTYFLGGGLHRKNLEKQKRLNFGAISVNFRHWSQVSSERIERKWHY